MCALNAMQLRGLQVTQTTCASSGERCEVGRHDCCNGEHICYSMNHEPAKCHPSEDLRHRDTRPTLWLAEEGSDEGCASSGERCEEGRRRCCNHEHVCYSMNHEPPKCHPSEDSRHRDTRPTLWLAEQGSDEGCASSGERCEEGRRRCC